MTGKTASNRDLVAFFCSAVDMKSEKSGAGKEGGRGEMMGVKGVLSFKVERFRRS